MADSRTHVGKLPDPLGETTVARLHRKAWIVPLAGAAIVAIAGVWSVWTVERTMRSELREDLTTVRDSQAQAVDLWLEGHRRNLEIVLGDPEFRTRCSEVLDLVERRSGDPTAAVGSAELSRLRERLERFLAAGGYVDFGLVDRGGRIVASRDDDLIGVTPARRRPETESRLLRGEVVVAPPLRVESLGAGGSSRRAATTMFVARRLGEPGDASPPVFGFRIDPVQFTAIFQVGRFGRSGETYAFDRAARLISHSRFEDQLVRAGLVRPEDPDGSLLSVQVRDPGGDLTRGYRSRIPAGAQPLTVAAAGAIEGKAGFDVDGYRDYRGVPVVGAWMWLDSHDFGIATEVDQAEAFAAVTVLRRTFWGLIALLVLASIGLLAYSLRYFAARREASEARRLGQYTLHEKLGEGGMGEIYRASHAFLQRPTAVKILRPEVDGAESVARFEREVQVTSRLAHPNTVAVYDFGRAADGTFYYAMEYLRGYSASDLVRKHGPLPEGRVVHILDQVCGSLAEAHEAGLIHRDIKPGNVMVCLRGGIPDLVKVLDFGLVREVRQSAREALTEEGHVTGTPLYMSPEAIRTPDLADARSDLYSLGAVAYFLLTGGNVFSGDDVVQVVTKQVLEAPEPPSSRLGRPVTAAFETLILRCLAKAPGERPQSARELRDALASLDGVRPWSAAEAEAWWKAHPPAEAGRDHDSGSHPEPSHATGRLEPQDRPAVSGR